MVGVLVPGVGRISTVWGFSTPNPALFKGQMYTGAYLVKWMISLFFLYPVWVNPHFRQVNKVVFVVVVVYFNRGV